MKTVVIALLLLLSASLLSILAISHQVSLALTQTAQITQPETLHLKSGTAVYNLLDQLDSGGIYTNSVWLKIAIRFNPDLGNVKAGHYEILPNMSLSALLDNMVRADEKQILVSLVEGLTLSQWITQLNNTPFLTSPLSHSELIEWSKSKQIQGGTFEGWLLADSYAVTYGTPVIDVLERAHLAMQKELAKLWANRSIELPYKSEYEALILASIIEKETGVPSERPHIAGVFVNRLNANMRLQTDPTVIYGIGDDFDGNLTRKHLRTPTDYNTYVIKGLPPTPIAMTSRASLFAAFNPLLTDDFYFVAKGDGTHYFSATLEQHNRAVREYQLGLKE